MSLSAIPLPLRIIGGLLIGMLLFRFLGGMGPLLLIIGLVLWLAVGLALLYDSGAAAGLGGVPALGALLDRITNRSEARPPPPDAREKAAPAAPRGSLGAEEREKLLAEAYERLDGLTGQAAAADLIETRVFEPIRSAPEDGPAFATRAPALAVILSGPRGVGLADAAFAVARGVAGLGALNRAHIAELRARDLRGDATDAATKKAEEANGGTLYLPDADWLLAADPYGGASPGVEAGLAILDVAERRPHSFLIVATLPEGMEETLRANDDHRRWLDRLAVRSIRLEGLEDDMLVDVLAAELEALGCPLEEEGRRPARALVREVREAQGAAFDNAEACRRLAEQLSAAETEMTLEAGAEPPVPGASRPIARRHVMRVQETWE
ncbi:MAG: hypothetical protein AAGA32_06700 [Pseudomonadota bacterium]